MCFAWTRELFNKNCCSLSDYNLSMSNKIIAKVNNRLLREELDHNIHELEQEHSMLFNGLNK